MKQNFLISSLILSFFLIVAGCSPEAEQPEVGPLPGLANPASVYCQGLGFAEETRENEAGQYGVCVFPDGTECDTWDFLAGRCGQEHSYCVDQGYQLISSQDGNIGTCLFDGGSTCSEFLYFEGNCQPGEKFP